jgi:diguanylate cyclase (GGDEF)-like protein
MQSSANDEITNSDFAIFVERVEKLQYTNITDAQVLLDAYQSKITTLSVENQVKYYQLLSKMYAESAQYKSAQVAASKGLEIAQHLTSPTILISELSYLRGFSLESLGDAEGAIENYFNGLEVAESLDEQKIIAEGLINLGAIYYLTEQLEKSITMLNNALIIANKINNDELMGSVNSELGILYSYMYNPKKSVEFYQASYEYYKKAGMDLYALNSLQNIAVNHMDESRYEQAILLFEEIIESADKFSSNEVVGRIYTSLALSHVNKEEPDLDTAYNYITIAEKYLKSAQQHNALIHFNVNKAYVLKAMNRFDEALESLEAAEKLLAINNKTKNTYSHYNLMYLQSDIYYKTNKYQQAYNKQSEYLTRLFEEQLSVNMDKIEELRLSFESKQADLRKKILEQEESVQVMQLNDVTYHEKNLQLLIASVALILAALAWFLLKLLKSQKHLVRISQTDDLTGVVNRRRLMELGEELYINAQKYSQCFSVLMLDVDNFKAINDNFGHSIGDKVLKEIAKLTNDVMRETDCFGRFGGEEFIALLPETSHQSAEDIAQRIRINIQDKVWSYKHLTKVTVSIGVSSYQRERETSFAQLLRDADVMMYKAKKLGRNKVCSS